MKKLYFITFLALSYVSNIQAQCDVDPNNNEIGMTPGDLGSFCVNKEVDQVLQLAIPNDTTLGPVSVDFDSVFLSVKGSIPTGLDYDCANGCMFYRTGSKGELSRGCVKIFGTPTTATVGEADTLKFNAHVWANPGGFSTQYDQTYDIEIVILGASDPACKPNGLENFNIGSSLSVYPNPSKGKATIEIDLPNATNVNVELYDVLGNKLGTIYSGNMNQGINTVSTGSIETLEKGMYMIKVDLDTAKGTRTYTERMIVK